jgi:GNAT superfamily N-acetyltransferase
MPAVRRHHTAAVGAVRETGCRLASRTVVPRACGTAKRSAHEGGQKMSGSAFVIRAAGDEDLDAIAGFEIEIARVSFGDEAIEDPALHRRRVGTSLGKPGEIALVAVRAAADGSTGDGPPVGWAWLSGRTNSLTGDRYGNFRSLAAADIPERGQVGELLMTAVLRAAADAGYTRLTGKTHARNLGMRALYRKFGFEAAHITMEWRAERPATGVGGP